MMATPEKSTAKAKKAAAPKKAPAAKSEAKSEKKSGGVEHLVLETTKGDVVIKFRPDLAPNHVAHIKRLAAWRMSIKSNAVNPCAILTPF